MGSENARKYVIVASNSCIFAQNTYQFNAMKPLRLAILLLSGLSGLCSFGQASNIKETERPNPAVAYDSYIRQADSCYMRRNYELSSDFFSKAFALRKQPVDKHLYNGACAAALAGDSTKAFERLFARVRLNPKWYSDLPDRDLQMLHSSPRWKILCDTMQVRKAFFERNYDHKLKSRLDSIHLRDQMPRHAYLAALRETPQDSGLVRARLRDMQLNDSINQIEVFDILDTYGWPSSEIVGGSNFSIWEVVQHTSLEAVEKYLPLFQKAAADNELNKSFVAMMEDRCNMWRNRPQKYGTQCVRNENGEFVPYTLLDPENVDKWRAKMGLPPLQEYIQQMNRQ